MNKKLPIIKILLTLSVIVNIGNAAYILRQNAIDQRRKKAEAIRKYTCNRDQLYKVLSVSDSDFVFIGDSQIQKFELNEFLGRNNLKNRGIDGDFCEGVYNRLNDAISGHPAKLFIEVGVNDVKRKTPLDTAMYYYNKILKKVKIVSPNTKIYYISILPCKLVDNVMLVSYNEGLKNLCQKNGITFINAYPEFNDNGRLRRVFDCGDDVHLSGEGYIALSSLIKPHLP